ncbi:MAG: beta-lactamase family protein [Anaerolineae bacterium]|nr:beta-lactamase family protein [Anaerolineae bacterium]
MILEPKTIAQIVESITPAFTGVVAVHEAGNSVFTQGYGYANRAERLPNTPETRFGVASGSKIFTAVAICQLVEQGRLSFDARLLDLVDADFPHFDPGITIHHLLTHTSGAPDYFDEEFMDDFAAMWEKTPVYTLKGPRDLLPLFQQQPMKFAPGMRFSYNNGGYVLLGVIIEAVTGQRYVDYVTENVLMPAGMASSGYFPMHALPEHTAYGYIEDENGSWTTNIFAVPAFGQPDGGAFITATDMARFWEALHAYHLLPAEMVAKMLTLQIAEDDSNGYGYGVWLKHQAGAVNAYYVMGEDPGVSFLSRVYPATKRLLTVIGNTDNAAWPVTDAVNAYLTSA